MIKPVVKIVEKTFNAEKINKQMDFGTAVGLTRTAKRGQEAVRGALRGTFTLRGSWFEQQNKFGIKVKPATKTDLKSAVWTDADWLKIHEEGGDKSGKGGHRVAVPTVLFRPRSSTRKITRAMRPGVLLASGKAFIVKTDRGEVVAMHKGRGDNERLQILYGLEGRVHVKKQSTFFEPIRKVVDRFLKYDVAEGIAYAWRTAK
jgi:hypothetical protein